MTTFKVGDKVRFKKGTYDFWERWFKRSFKFDDVVTIGSLDNGWEVAFEESEEFIADFAHLEHALDVDKDGQMKLMFKWGG